MALKDVDHREFGPEEWHEQRTDFTEARCAHCGREFFTDHLVTTSVDEESVQLCFVCVRDYEEVACE
jgi:hypothetical protein